MRILFLGDYSNLHACLAKELKTRGHHVTVVSDGGRYMDTERDILLCRNPGKLNALRYVARILRTLPHLRGYDIVQLINPHFLSLRPEKLRYIFRILRRYNGTFFLTLAGNDFNFCNACLNSRLFKFSEFKSGNEFTEYESTTHRAEQWTTPKMKEHNDFICDNVAGAMSVLPEYDMAARPMFGDRLVFTNIPVDLSSPLLQWKPMDTTAPIRLFIGMRRGMEIQKGTAALLEMCRRIERDMPERCRVSSVSNLSLSEYLTLMSDSHIVFDQLYSYSPGTNGFQAMALGRVAATGAQPEFYRYISRQDTGAIIPLSPLQTMEEIECRIRGLIANPDELIRMGREGREIVEQNNDVGIVASRFEAHWNHILG